jgi:hypothetical protein
MPLYKKNISGLRHSETFCTMNLGTEIASPTRFNITDLGHLYWWQSEQDLESHLASPSNSAFHESSWHIRLKPYRSWGEIKKISQAQIHSIEPEQDQPVVAVTHARLKLTETFRFIKWGKPVEVQVRDHPGNSFAFAAFRPPMTFSTFSIWETEQEMLNMVGGKSQKVDGSEHKLAMQGRSRRPFHFEFTTMRFLPLSEHGEWKGVSSHLPSGKQHAP